MLCGQDFSELKSQMLTFLGPFILDTFRYKLHCNPSFCSLSAFSYTGKHPCPTAWDWSSACKIRAWSWFRASMSLTRTTDSIYSTKWNADILPGAQGGAYMPPWRSPMCHLHSPTNRQTWDKQKGLFFFLFVLKYLSFSCLQNSFLPWVPLEQGEGPLLRQRFTLCIVLSIFPSRASRAST